MRPAGSGRLTVLAEDAALATDVPFEVAHEFVHEACILREAGEEHTEHPVLIERDDTVAPIDQAARTRSASRAFRTLRDSA